MTQEDTREAIAALTDDAEHRVTDYYRWSNNGWFIEVSVDALGKVSYSTNLPVDLVSKDLAWPEADARFAAALTAAIGYVNTLDPR